MKNKYKFNIYDPIYIREDEKDNTPFDFDEEILYMVVDIIDDLEFLDQNNFKNEKFVYKLKSITPDFGSGIVSENDYFFKETVLRKYDGDDEDTLYFANDGKLNYIKEIEDQKYKIDYHINYKFKQKDILILKEGESKNKSIFIVITTIEDSNLYNVDKNKLIEKGNLYLLEEYKESNDEFICIGWNYYKEDEFDLYTGNDNRIFKIIKERFKS